MNIGSSTSFSAQPTTGTNMTSRLMTQVVFGNTVTCQYVSSVDVCLIMMTLGSSGRFSSPSTTVSRPQITRPSQTARRHQPTVIAQGTLGGAQNVSRISAALIATVTPAMPMNSSERIIAMSAGLFEQRPGYAGKVVVDGNIGEALRECCLGAQALTRANQDWRCVYSRRRLEVA